MLQDKYYIIPKERLDTFLKDCELNARIRLINDSKLIDLSDESIDKKAEKYSDEEQSCWTND